MFTFTFTEQEVVNILNGLAELPYKFSADLIHNIQRECQLQSIAGMGAPEVSASEEEGV